MKRREFLRASVAGTVFGALNGAGGEATPRKRPPNILIIMADDLGMECLESYGGQSYKTPHLNALAHSGVQFTHCYSTPKCVPSRVNILTGRYGFRTGQVWGHIPPDEVTFGHVLKKAGYATAVAGKWQLALLGDDPAHPHKMGFDEYCCWAWHEGPRYWQPMIWQNTKVLDGVEEHYGPDVYTDFLIDFMTRHKEGPFLAYYPMCLTHFAKTGGAYQEPRGPDGKYQSFSEMVHQMDLMVGKLLKTLDGLGLREDTLILFTGDNGSPAKVISLRAGEKVMGGKGEHTDAGTHVPLLASWSGTAPAGKTCDDLVDFSDFLPTLATLANADLPEEPTIDGRSFVPQIHGKDGNPRDWVYTEWKGKAWIRTKRWKLYDDGMFYDVEEDPRELQPLPVRGLSGEKSSAWRMLKRELKRLRDSEEM